MPGNIQAQLPQFVHHLSGPFDSEISFSCSLYAFKVCLKYLSSFLSVSYNSQASDSLNGNQLPLFGLGEVSTQLVPYSFNNLSRISTNNCKWWHILCDYSSSRNNGSIADYSCPRHYYCSGPDPGPLPYMFWDWNRV